MRIFREHCRKRRKLSYLTLLFVQFYRIRKAAEIERKTERKQIRSVRSSGYSYLFRGLLARFVRRNKRAFVRERQNALARTDFDTVAALHALIVIDDGEVVTEFYRARRAIPLALATADAAFFARADYFFAAAEVGTRDVHYRVDGNSADNALGTSRHARAARGT